MSFKDRPPQGRNKSFASSPALAAHRSSRETTVVAAARSYNSSPAPGVQRRRGHLSDGGVEDGDQDSEKELEPILWGKLHRRPNSQSSEAHQPVFNRAKMLLLARIFSGSGPGKRRCSPWPDRSQRILNTMVGECWTYVRSRRGKKYHLDTSLYVDEIPTQDEAKKVKGTLTP